MNPRIEDVLRRAVLSSDTSLNALAKEVDLTQPPLWRFAHGQGGISLQAAQRIADHFGLELRPARRAGRSAAADG